MLFVRSAIVCLAALALSNASTPFTLCDDVTQGGVTFNEVTITPWPLATMSRMVVTYVITFSWTMQQAVLQTEVFALGWLRVRNVEVDLCNTTMTGITCPVRGETPTPGGGLETDVGEEAYVGLPLVIKATVRDGSGQPLGCAQFFTNVVAEAPSPPPLFPSPPLLPPSGPTPRDPPAPPAPPLAPPSAPPSSSPAAPPAPNSPAPLVISLGERRKRFERLSAAALVLVPLAAALVAGAAFLRYRWVAGARAGAEARGRGSSVEAAARRALAEEGPKKKKQKKRGSAAARHAHDPPSASVGEGGGAPEMALVAEC